MKHFGNVCNIDGKSVDPADVIIFGAPCQDLSVAGKRSGMKHEVLGDNETTRSGLFFEAIRIIKEMRESTNGEYPKYAVYENVPGAFSSNKGRDFHAVLEALCSVCDNTVSIPEPYDKKRTKLVWAKAGEIVGDNYSVAWRTLDAQYWGVPQRRRRIALVADLGGQSAPEILFERSCGNGNLAQSGAEGQGVAGDAKGGVTTAGGSDVTSTLFAAYGTKWNGNSGALTGDHFVLDDACGNHVVPTTYFLQGNGIDRADTAGCNGKGWREDVCYTLNTIDRPAVFDARGNGDGSVATYSFQRTDELKESQVASTQSARQYKSPTDLVAAVDCRNGTVVGALCARDYKGVGSQYVDEGKCIPTERSVRRLTPLECERLQGFPDNWTNIPPQTEVTAEDLSFWRTVWNEWQEMNGARPKTDKQIIKWLQSEPADSARYKALGNSIALPPWRFVLSRIHKQGARTMASLFDGIGGFPKIWQELGGQTLWASEVEPYAIAVTKSRFKEAHNG